MRTSRHLLAIAAFTIGCGDDPAASPPVPEPDAGPNPDAALDADVDAQTPTSWTRTYKQSSYKPSWSKSGVPPQTHFCTDASGRLLFAGIWVDSRTSDSLAVILRADGEQELTIRGNVSPSRIACGSESFAFAGGLSGEQDVFNLAGGTITRVEDSDFLAGVDSSGQFSWGRAVGISGTNELRASHDGWGWLARSSSAVDVGCGAVPDWQEEKLDAPTVLARLDLSGRCVHSERIANAPVKGGFVRSFVADPEGTTLLWFENEYDVLVERRNNQRERVWATNFYRGFTTDMSGKLFRSNGDGGYFVFGEVGGAYQPTLLKLSADGTEQWRKQVAEWTDGRMAAMTPDINGGMLVGGRFMRINGQGTATLCGQTYTPAAEGDGFVMRIDDQGSCSWIRLFSTPLFDQVNAIATSPIDGAILVAWEDWPEEAWLSEDLEPVVNLHITKYVPK
ncbi:MAG: hypothetical protein MUF54_21870 [Polyangiaceae bacterium]|nr:hypothetical protein [Polyangiaceae bacterium]